MKKVRKPAPSPPPDNSTEIVPAPATPGGAVEIAELTEKAREYVERSKAASSKLAYRNDWRYFQGWCDARGIAALSATPEVVALYITFLAENGKKPATIQRRLVSISVAFKTAGLDSPTTSPVVKAVHAGVRRTLGVYSQGKAAFTVEALKVALSRLPADMRGHRDRALLLVGFAGGMRRSEIVALNVEDVQFLSGGCAVTIRRGKRDQEAKGRVVGLPFGTNPITCPVLNLRKWLDAAAIATTGPIFRPVSRSGVVLPRRLDDQSVALVVKRAMALTGLDPKAFSGHSLRVSFCSVAAAAGVPDRVIALQTGHRPGSTVLSRYIRRSGIWIENAASKLGL